MGAFRAGKPRSIERRRITRSRCAFRFRTGETRIRLVKYRGKTRIFRSSQEGKKIVAEKDLLKLRIFHTLFPQNSLTPLGIAFIEEGEKRVWGVVTKIVRKRSSDYKKTQTLFYTDPKKYVQTKDEAILRHQDFVENVAMPLSLKIEENAGIVFDNAPVNVCNVEGTPLFFEVYDIRPQTCSRCIEHTVANEKQKKRLIGFLERLDYIEREILHRR